jgi:hypothetical protein
MRLATAANRFARTPISGWNGTAWVANVTTVTLLPFDRFISEREFGNKRRFLLVRPNDTTFDTYSVIKLPSQEIYLVGMHDSDIQVDEYSRSLLIHRVQGLADLIGFTKVIKASGMAGTAVRAVLRQVWCDTERVTSSKSKEFDQIAFTQVTLTFPRDCVVDTENEVQIGGQYYTLSESYMASGFRQCRGMAKRSADVVLPLWPPNTLFDSLGIALTDSLSIPLTTAAA